MSQKLGILSLSNPSGRTQNAVLGKLSILVVGLSAVVLIALALVAVVPTVSNPELRLFQHHAAAVSNRAEAQFLASNPEVRTLRRYAAQSTGQ
jgi:hypothetical protein